MKSSLEGSCSSRSQQASTSWGGTSGTWSSLWGRRERVRPSEQSPGVLPGKEKPTETAPKCPPALGAVGKAAQSLTGWTLPSPSCLGDEGCQPRSCPIHPGRQRTRSSHSPLASGTSRSGAARIPSASRPEPPRTRPAQSKHRVGGRPSRNPALLPGDSEAQPQLGAPGKPSRPHSPRGDRDVPVLTTASRKLTQRASSGRVSQNCRNSARPMGCLSHRLW